MPSLDFLTLYVVIFLNSITVGVIWAAVAISYQEFKTARIWLASTALSFAGGIVLAMKGNEISFWGPVIGNVFVIYAFFMAWIGIRHFYGTGGGWTIAAVLTAICAAIMGASYYSWEGRNIVYAVGQSIPMVLSIVYLIRLKRIGVGAGIAIGAMFLGIVGHSVETGLNIIAWTGAFDLTTYFSIESYALVCTIYSAVVWNFGFIIMSIDRLRSEMAVLADTDDLTGLPNRRNFMRQLGEAEKDFAASGTPFSVILFDIDHFKTLNDTQGHAFGDTALQHFSNVLRRVVRAPHLIARTGGDEFCALLWDTQDQAALEVAQSALLALRQSPLVFDRKEVQLLASIGVGTKSREDDDRPSDIMAEADFALYRVKQAGRNAIALRNRLIKDQVNPPVRLVVSDH